MAQHKSALKRNKQNEKRREQNKSQLSRLKTMVKKVHSSKTKEEAAPLVRQTTALADRYAAKGLIHKNKAANTKRTLTLFANSLQASEKKAE